jgi:hypothetical protein
LFMELSSIGGEAEVVEAMVEDIEEETSMHPKPMTLGHLGELSQPAQPRRTAKIVGDNERIETLTLAGQRGSARAQASTTRSPWCCERERESKRGGGVRWIGLTKPARSV